ncbi:hypothetical protein HPB47_007476 [Ixodes persulcatus]|uniref:Uncharacterized protein n=1 Tax=Ixodes persulcatus TaxID=34615 RepID=A0AC60P7J4_IXOPE|nr:hypothetical protein HPB47_007476 [Ixodes persulcatus]
MVSLQSPVRIATLNVRGLSDRRRQRQLYRLAVEQDLDIIAVQETKVERSLVTKVSKGTTRRMQPHGNSYRHPCPAEAQLAPSTERTQ